MGFLSVFRAPTLEDVAEDEFDPHILAEQQRRSRLLQDGELEADDINGVSEVHWAPRRPRLLSGVPAKSGWRAVRRRGTRQWAIVEVLEARGGLWWAYGPREPARRVDQSADYEWGDQRYELPL